MTNRFTLYPSRYLNLATMKVRHAVSTAFFGNRQKLLIMRPQHTGGYFQLITGEALFKVPRRSAIVFFGESLHGVTEIQSGERSVFVTEYWEEEDAPIGSKRPNLNDPTSRLYKSNSIETEK